MVGRMPLAEFAMYTAAYAFTMFYAMAICMAWIALIRGAGDGLRRLAQ
jgi:hypothetical protein